MRRDLGHSARSDVSAVRVLGQVFGFGWSQLNLNAITGMPQPTADDLAGLPVMHALDLPGCVPVSKRYPLEFVTRTQIG